MRSPFPWRRRRTDGYGSSWRFGMSLFFISCIGLARADNARGQESEGEGTGGNSHAIYGSVGLGIVGLERGSGAGIPMGLTAILAPFRLIATASLLDIGLTEGKNRNPRFERVYIGGGRRVCVDSLSGFFVADFRCAGGTDVLGSANVDLSYILAQSLWIGDHPGKLFAGLGYRLFNPRTPYGTLGIFFNSPAGRAIGIKISSGVDYMFVGLHWGFNLGRWFGKENPSLSSTRSGSNLEE